MMGMLPHNYPVSGLTNSADDEKNENDPKIPRRRGRPVSKPKPKETLFDDSECDSGMFQISALAKLFAG